MTQSSQPEAQEAPASEPMPAWLASKAEALYRWMLYYKHRTDELEKDIRHHAERIHNQRAEINRLAALGKQPTQEAPADAKDAAP